MPFHEPPVRIIVSNFSASSSWLSPHKSGKSGRFQYDKMKPEILHTAHRIIQSIMSSYLCVLEVNTKVTRKSDISTTPKPSTNLQAVSNMSIHRVYAQIWQTRYVKILPTVRLCVRVGDLLSRFRRRRRPLRSSQSAPACWTCLPSRRNSCRRTRCCTA